MGDLHDNIFKNLIKRPEGVYHGPRKWNNDIKVFYDEGITSLGNLRVCSGNVTIENMDGVFSTGDLQVVEGNLIIERTVIEPVTQIKEVYGEISLDDACEGILKNLEVLTRFLVIPYSTPVPFFPKIKTDFTVAYQYSWRDDHVPPHEKYSSILARVTKPALEELIPLRESDPTLTLLIDARLKGDLE